MIHQRPQNLYGQFLKCGVDGVGRSKTKLIIGISAFSGGEIIAKPSDSCLGQSTLL